MEKISKEEFEKRVVNNVICEDCIKVMKTLPDESVDLVFIDPPYFLQLPKKKLIRWTGTEVNGVNENWDKFANFEEYDKFTIDYLTEIKRLMKPNATFWVIGTYHNIFRIGKILHDLGFWVLNNVIWFKTNPVPNFLGVRFTNATEELIWAVKDKNAKKYTFNKELARELANGRLGINVWQLPICLGKERIKGKDGKKVHSTQKPEELMKRIILISTKKGDIILDPMAGTGTTGAIAKKHGRKYILIEKDEKYCKVIKERLDSIKGIQQNLEKHNK